MKCLMNFFEDHGLTILITVGVILFIGLVGFVGYYGWVEEDTAETIVMHDGSQFYACVVSRVDKTPHDCKPIKTAVSGSIMGLVS